MSISSPAPSRLNHLLALPVRIAGLIAQRILRALLTWPSLRGWGETLAVFLLLAAILVPFTIWSGWYTRPPISDPYKIMSKLWAAFWVPAFTEELICRAMLIPRKEENASRPYFWLAVGLSFAFYVGVHPLNGFLHNKPFFLTWQYLVTVALLGVACTLSYIRTSSLWPSVFIHMAIVGSWGIMRG